MSLYKTTRNYSFLATLLLIVMTQTLIAAPRPINYQGYLAQPDGTPIDTAISVVVEIWTAATAGTLLYSESHAAVTVSKGRFSIEISTGTPVSGTFNADQFLQDTWLALTINGELLNPRSRLGAVAGSQHAEIAERLSTSCADGEWLGFRGGQIDCYECAVGSSTGSCYEGDPATLGVGVCKAGTFPCIDGAYGNVCSAQVLPDVESCNSLDDDCNGLVDDGTSLPGCVSLYIDTDGDGFGDNTTLGCLCSASNTVAVGGDCDDTDMVTNPGQTSYFAVPNSQGSFDYNCDSILENNSNSNQPVATCTWNGSSCDYSPGFIDSVPNCGEVGSYSGGCSNAFGTACIITFGGSSVTQSCR